MRKGEAISISSYCSALFFWLVLMKNLFINFKSFSRALLSFTDWSKDKANKTRNSECGGSVSQLSIMAASGFWSSCSLHKSVWLCMHLGATFVMVFFFHELKQLSWSTEVPQEGCHECPRKHMWHIVPSDLGSESPVLTSWCCVLTTVSLGIKDITGKLMHWQRVTRGF